MCVLLSLVVIGTSHSSWQLNTTVLDNNQGLDTMNITINGVQYPAVKYVNITTGQRAAIDIGSFTIPSGCYPCLGESYCLNIYRPWTCLTATECFWTEESDECQSMLTNATARAQHCKDCHESGQDYCIEEDECVSSNLGSCLNIFDQVTVSSDLARLGMSTVCDFSNEIIDNGFSGEHGSTSSVLESYKGIFIVSGILVCLIFGCASYLYWERRELKFQVFNNEDFRVCIIEVP